MFSDVMEFGYIVSVHRIELSKLIDTSGNSLIEYNIVYKKWISPYNLDNECF